MAPKVLPPLAKFESAATECISIFSAYPRKRKDRRNILFTTSQLIRHVCGVFFFFLMTCFISVQGFSMTVIQYLIFSPENEHRNARVCTLTHNTYTTVPSHLRSVPRMPENPCIYFQHANDCQTCPLYVAVLVRRSKNSAKVHK